MLELILQKFKIPIILVAFWSLVFGFFCVGMSHEQMMTMENMNMAGVTTVQGDQTCCGGIMSQHMQSWANTFLAIPHEGRDMLKLFALGLLLSFVITRGLFVPKPSNDFTFSYRQYLRRHPNLFALQPLRLAFARGVLNPKVF